MHSTDIAAYTIDGDILCPDCAARRPHRFTVYTGVRTGTRTRGAIVDGSVDLGTHDSHAEAMEYAREVAGIALDDDGEIMDDDGVYTAWTVDEIDGAPAFAGYESDSVDRCADCGDIVDGCDLTQHGRQTLAARIADAIAGEYRGSIDRLQEDADAAGMSVDLHRAAHLYAEIGGTYTHATLRAPDLLRAAAHCAEAVTRYARSAGYSMNVAPLADAAEAAQALVQRVDEGDTVDDIHGSEIPHGLLEASYTAGDYHGGQSSALYALSCAQWQHLTRADMYRAAAEMRDILARAETHAQEDDPPIDDARTAAEYLTRWTEQHPPVDPEDIYWTLRDIVDDIDAALPAGLYYGAHPDDGVDVGIWPADLSV